MSYEVGQAVIVDGVKGYTVVKVNRSSCKVEKDGKTSIKPLAFIEPAEASTKKKPAGTSRKRATKKTSGIKKVAGGKKVNPNKVHKEDYEIQQEEEGKKNSRKRSKTSYTRDDDDGDDTSAADTVSQAPKSNKKRSTVQDPITKLLSKEDTVTKMINAVKKHKAYKHINQDAFKRVISQKNELGMGLIRMRLGNLLRGAVNRSKK